MAHRIVILGAGFRGLDAGKSLRNAPVEATLAEDGRLLGLLTRKHLTGFLLLRRSGMEPVTSRG